MQAVKIQRSEELRLKICLRFGRHENGDIIPGVKFLPEVVESRRYHPKQILSNHRPPFSPLVATATRASRRFISPPVLLRSLKEVAFGCRLGSMYGAGARQT